MNLEDLIGEIRDLIKGYERLIQRIQEEIIGHEDQGDEGEGEGLKDALDYAERAMYFWRNLQDKKVFKAQLKKVEKELRSLKGQLLFLELTLNKIKDTVDSFGIEVFKLYDLVLEKAGVYKEYEEAMRDE